MARRKKADQTDSHSETEETNGVRLWFRGELLELVPTAEYPIQVLQTEEYEAWINGISDSFTKARVTSNVAKIRRGLLGDWKEVGAGVFEMRLDFGPGYRVYYAKHRKVVVILLGGGEKSGQRQDITTARRLWEEVKNEITQV